jgi:hypothetical protein
MSPAGGRRPGAARGFVQAAYAVDVLGGPVGDAGVM